MSFNISLNHNDSFSLLTLNNDGAFSKTLNFSDTFFNPPPPPPGGLGRLFTPLFNQPMFEIVPQIQIVLGPAAKLFKEVIDYLSSFGSLSDNKHSPTDFSKLDKVELAKASIFQQFPTTNIQVYGAALSVCMSRKGTSDNPLHNVSNNFDDIASSDKPLNSFSINFDDIGSIDIKVDLPASNGLQSITLSWNNRSAAISGYITGDQTNLNSAVSKRLMPDDPASLTPIKINEEIEIYVNDSQVKKLEELKRQIAQYQKFNRRLKAWKQEVNLTDVEQANRAIALQKIQDCYLNKTESLDLSFLQLTSLPKCLGHLVHLADLNLCGNELTHLPHGFTKLVNLSTLNLEKNRLQALPDNFGDLKALTSLLLSYNQLQTLPESFGDLTTLTGFLSLEENPINDLPDSILNLPSNLEINLTGHNLSQTDVDDLLKCIKEDLSLGILSPRFIGLKPKNDET